MARWTFPAKNFILMRVEKVSLMAIAVTIFFISFLQLEDWRYALLFAVLFIGVYLVTAYFIQLLRQVEEKYNLEKGVLNIIRTTRSTVKKETIPLRKIISHKLDRFLLGGYILTRKGKHLLFFNTRRELEGFEKELRKYRSI